MSDGRGAHRTAACLDSGRGGCSNRCVPRRRSGETARRLVVLALCALAAGVLAGQAHAALRCGGLEPTIIGTDGADFLVGTPGPDVIDGKGGHDVIFGKGGNDHICGRGGPDDIRGGNGKDHIEGNDGRDELHGGRKSDYINGRLGDDVIWGQEGWDTLGGRGVDNFSLHVLPRQLIVTVNLSTHVATGVGHDTVYGIENVSRRFGTANDTFIGNGGPNILRGGRGADHIEGRAGDDILNGGDGVDFLDGGGGSDICRRGETVLNCEKI